MKHKHTLVGAQTKGRVTQAGWNWKGFIEVISEPSLQGRIGCYYTGGGKKRQIGIQSWRKPSHQPHKCTGRTKSGVTCASQGQGPSGNPSVLCPLLSLRRGPGPQEARGAYFAAGESRGTADRQNGPRVCRSLKVLLGIQGFILQ